VARFLCLRRPSTFHSAQADRRCIFLSRGTELKADTHSQGEIISQLAVETQMPRDVVEREYLQSLDDLSNGALVRDYLTLFASKRVKAKVHSKKKN
jgi:hypothetical protein